MVDRANALAVAAVLLWSCAAPTVDRAATGFDEKKFAEDLADCRGGSAGEVALSGAIGVLVGSAVGAAEGASWGALSGGSAEGAAKGSIVGGVIGLGVGAHAALTEEEKAVRACLSAKGYVLEREVVSNENALTKADAYVLSEPSVRATRLETVVENSKIGVLGKVKGKGWYAVDRNGRSPGFVWGGFLKPAG